MFEHSCCYCNSQKNLLNAFLHDVRTNVSWVQLWQRAAQNWRPWCFIFALFCFLACLPVSFLFLLPYPQIRVQNTHTHIQHTITMFGPVSSCTTLLLVIGRREIRFYIENDHVFSLLNYLLFDICFFCCFFFFLLLLRRFVKFFFSEEYQTRSEVQERI